MDDNFRPLTISEIGLLRKLLEPEFPGCEELREQLRFVTGKIIDEEGGLALKCDGGRPAPVQLRVPTEGEIMDSDGMRINVLLHVVDGFMNELEIYKDDSSALLNPPSAVDLVLVNPSRIPVVDWSGKNKPSGGIGGSGRGF